METPGRPVPAAVARDRDIDRALAELTAAIDLVALGSASRVIVACVSAVDAVATEALAHAQQVGVAFTLSRDAATGAVSVVVGPRDA
jgi:hypothetical protein